MQEMFKAMGKASTKWTQETWTQTRNWKWVKWAGHTLCPRWDRVSTTWLDLTTWFGSDWQHQYKTQTKIGKVNSQFFGGSKVFLMPLGIIMFNYVQFILCCYYVPFCWYLVVFCISTNMVTDGYWNRLCPICQKISNVLLFLQSHFPHSKYETSLTSLYLGYHIWSIVKIKS